MSELLLKHFDLLAQAPDGVKRLRELILTLAVQGKLVPQDPNDEPASVLLERIRAEKGRLMAEGKIKRDKPLPPIAEEEKPFDLPDGWEWVRLGTVFSLEYGAPLPDKVRVPGPNLVYGSNGVVGSHVEALVFSPSLIVGRKGSVGAINVAKEPFWPIDTSYFVTPPSGIELNYSFNLFLSLRLGRHDKSTAIPGINRNDIYREVIAIPPQAEQTRIVARVEELMRLCDALEAKAQLDTTQHAQLLQTLLGTLTDSASPEELAENWQRVAAHFDLLLDRPEAVDSLEQTILQLAVRGLLVPQDPSDEPASVLLERIRAEKDRLIAEGKIKRDKPIPPVTDEEKPFELPSGWEWSTLAEVGLINPRNEAKDEAIASFVQMSSIPVAFLEPHFVEPRPWREIKSGFTQFAEGDVGLAKITPCFENGKSTVFQNLAGGIGAGTTELHVVRPLGGIPPRYILLFLKTPRFLREGETVMTGSAGQKRVPRAYFEGKPFPLPPLDEQFRVVTRVEELMQLCSNLRAQLAAYHSAETQLADALVVELPYQCP